jgi:hypothetical protein
MANAVRSIENVTITMALKAVREEDSKIVQSYFFPRTRIIAFKAKECSTMHFRCTETLIASSVLEVSLWGQNTSWTKLKEYLRVYLPGYGWSCWGKTDETLFDAWCEDAVTRGHLKNLGLSLGVDEEARRLGAGNSAMMATEGVNTSEETFKVLTEDLEAEEGVESNY